jgi:hypothetical protein
MEAGEIARADEAATHVGDEQRFKDRSELLPTSAPQ